MPDRLPGPANAEVTADAPPRLALRPRDAARALGIGARSL